MPKRTKKKKTSKKPKRRTKKGRTITHAAQNLAALLDRPFDPAPGPVSYPSGRAEQTRLIRGWQTGVLTVGSSSFGFVAVNPCNLTSNTSYEYLTYTNSTPTAADAITSTAAAGISGVQSQVTYGYTNNTTHDQARMVMCAIRLNYLGTADSVNGGVVFGQSRGCSANDSGPEHLANYTYATLKARPNSRRVTARQGFITHVFTNFVPEEEQFWPCNRDDTIPYAAAGIYGTQGDKWEFEVVSYVELQDDASWSTVTSLPMAPAEVSAFESLSAYSGKVVKAMRYLERIVRDYGPALSRAIPSVLAVTAGATMLAIEG